MLSEHTLEGMLEGYLLSGRHGFFSTYEAFVHIIDSMFNQHAKWLATCNQLSWRAEVASLNLLITSTVWRQDHNGFTHQDPGFLDVVVNKSAEVTRIYLPPDANCLLSVADHCLRSENYVNVIVADKQKHLQYLTMEAAITHCTKGIGIWDWASNDEGHEPDVVMASAGDVATLEALAATAMLREAFPDLKLRFVNVVDLFKLQPATEHPHGLSDRDFDSLFTASAPSSSTSTATRGSSTASPTAARTTRTCTCAATRRRATSTRRWSWPSRTRSTGSAWRSTSSTACRACATWARTPRSACATASSSAWCTRTSTASTRPRSWAGAGRPRGDPRPGTKGGDREADARAVRARPEPLAGQHHPRAARERHAETVRRRALGDRAHLEPDDLRQRHLAQRVLRRGHRELGRAGLGGEALLFELALQDITRAADLFAPIHDRTAGVDGFASLEVSPLLAYDTERSVDQAKELHRKAARRNVFIKIPGTKEGLPAIEEAIFSGIPVNVTLLFSREHYLAAAAAYQRGLERRVAAGQSPDVRSVASIFLSRWDVAVAEKAPSELRHRLGVAVGRQAYQAYREVLDSDRWLRLVNAGARPQRLLFASTGTKDPAASDILYVRGLAAPNTVDTMPEKTLLAFADHGELSGAIPRDGGDAQQVLAAFTQAGVDLARLAATLQEEGARSFAASWKALMGSIEKKSSELH